MDKKIFKWRNIRRWGMAAGFLFLVTLLFFVGHARRQPLNVILLTIDACNSGHLGCYGYDRDTTPFLDSIADNGVIFRNVISAAPWTSPGLLSVFTGLYPLVHGVDARGKSVVSSIETVFDVFKQNGYLVPDLNYLSDLPDFSNLGLDKKDIPSARNSHSPDDNLLAWIEEHGSARFFLWYHYRSLHLPYKFKDEFTVFPDKKSKGLLNSPEVRTVQEQIIIPYKNIEFSEDQRAVVTALYDGRVHELDHFIQCVCDTLKTLGLLENTLLVITADHGEELFEHGFIGHASTTFHATLYDEAIKIPLILYAPSYFKRKTVIENQVRQIDIMPTILDIAGIDIPEQVQGISLVPLMKGGQTGETPPAFSESVMGGYQSTTELEKIKLSSIRAGGWKLIRTSGDGADRFELFHLADDPGEMVNLMDRETETAAALKKQLTITFEEMRIRRLALMEGKKTVFDEAEIPAGMVFEKPDILFPLKGGVVRPDESDVIGLKWSGNDKFIYIIEYDAGEGWRNLKGKIAVRGVTKTFGPLPPEVIEPLPYWNPYRIRVSPYGQANYWSEWTEFFVESRETGK